MNHLNGKLKCLWLMGFVVVFLGGCGKNSPPAAPTNSDEEIVERNNQAVGLMGQFAYEEARVIFAELAKERPENLEIKVNLAIAILNRQQEGDEQKAMGVLEEVLRVDPNHLRANYCAGLLKLYLEQPDEAKKHFEFVATHDPKDAYAAYQVGQCLAKERDYAAALARFEQVMALDPYLRSAPYAASQMLSRLGRGDEARAMIDLFKRLEKNPRSRVVKFIYTRMGPKGEVLAFDLEKTELAQVPDGSLFRDPIPLIIDESIQWNTGPGKIISLTCCDMDGDGDIDVFIAQGLREKGVMNAVCMNNGDGTFALDREHPLAGIEDVNAALWGDYDNDGLTDVYLCRRGGNQLWRHLEDGGWEDVSVSTGTVNGVYETVNGLFFDADHDGDLDIFCVNADGPNELLNNNLDGTFRPIAEERGIDGSDRKSRQVIAADLDQDRDLDLVVIHEVPPHQVFMNDRSWAYHPANGMDEFLQSEVMNGVAADLEGDGQLELVMVNRLGEVVQWRKLLSGKWIRKLVAAPEGAPWLRLGLGDFNGDGQQDMLMGGKSFAINQLENGEQLWKTIGEGDWMGLTMIELMPEDGPGVVAYDRNTGPMLYLPGQGRHHFASVSLTGKDDNSKSMRSNASGIGARMAVRVGSRWTVVDSLPHNSGPGQSLQPLSVGLGGAKRIDFVRIDWPDGVMQTELGLAGSERHKIEETQRQTSSCPVLFAWDGTGYAFVSDILGVGGMGFADGAGGFVPSRPWEKFMLPDGNLKSQNGRFSLKIAEPMEEALYLDSAMLVAIDLPPGWNMGVDERMNVAGMEPTGDNFYFTQMILPKTVMNNRGEEVSDITRTRDQRAAPVGIVDHRFIGRLAGEHTLTMEFEEILQEGATMVMDGWVEYPYSQTMFAAGQAGAAFRAPTIEARGADGVWRVILKEFGYPAGMPRQMSVPLGELPAGTTMLRISTNMEVYWDRLFVVYPQEVASVVRTAMTPVKAEVLRSGFALRTTGEQRLPGYSYTDRSPFWDTRYPTGYYTAFGDCLELVVEADSGLAIIGPGEEIHLEFGDDLPELRPGWTRRYVLEVEGWCKDMDLYTKDGGTLGPLPGEDSAVRRGLHKRFNTRFESGF